MNVVTKTCNETEAEETSIGQNVAARLIDMAIVDHRESAEKADKLVVQKSEEASNEGTVKAAVV